jgi:hypothetical protein
MFNLQLKLEAARLYLEGAAVQPCAVPNDRAQEWKSNWLLILAKLEEAAQVAKT